MSTEKKRQNIVLTFDLEEMEDLLGLELDQQDDLDCAKEVVRRLRLFKVYLREHLRRSRKESHDESDSEDSDEEETKHEVSEESDSEESEREEESDGEEEEYWECCGRDHGMNERCATCEHWMCTCNPGLHKKAEVCRKCKAVRPDTRT